jgi:hypothetical protein
MRSLLGLLCCLTLSVEAGPNPTPGTTRAQKIATTEALLVEISSAGTDGEAEALPEGLARAMDAWTGDMAEE